MKTILLAIISILIVLNNGQCCTTAVISGKSTEDGRPIIWKLRDSDSVKNKMMYFHDGKYNYIALINSSDSIGKEVWGGANSAGFAIMNSASFNVNIGDTSKIKDLEGYIMKQALQACSSLQDFEELLNHLAKPMGLAAHFGVIDSKGGAAFYEVNNYSFKKFDANDPAEAPNGFILRTNYSFTGKKNVGYGYVRYQTAQEIFKEALIEGKLNYKTIIQDFSRCFKNPILKKDYRKEYEKIPAGENFINTEDLITSYGSSSAILIQGVKQGEPADLSTIWTLIGYPNTCVALPVWVRGGKSLPKVLDGEKSKSCPLNNFSLKLKEQCYPIIISSGYRYLQISELINSNKTGIIQKIENIEHIIFKETDKKLSIWRKNKVEGNEIVDFYNWLDDMIINTYSKEFGVEHQKENYK
jgi:hypothetical protein